MRVTQARDIAILVLLAAALSVTLFHLAATIAPRLPDNHKTFIEAPSSWESFADLRKEWRPRVLSIYSARIAANLTRHWDHGNLSHLQRTVGAYSAFWLFATNLALIAGFRRRALPMIWGVFAAVVFGYAPGLVFRTYPWDLPALFFFTLFLVCWHRKWYAAIGPTILVGMLFKETTVVLLVAFLFCDLSAKARLWYLAGTAAAFAALKVGLHHALGFAEPFSSLSSRMGSTPKLSFNLEKLTSEGPFTSLLWVNAGTLLAALALPARSRTQWMIKTVLFAFAIGIFTFGSAREFRIWFEIAPLAVYALADHFLWSEGNSDATPDIARTENPG